MVRKDEINQEKINFSFNLNQGAFNNNLSTNNSLLSVNKNLQKYIPSFTSLPLQTLYPLKLKPL